jgi:hypothetical protein
LAPCGGDNNTIQADAFQSTIGGGGRLENQTQNSTVKAANIPNKRILRYKR